jgi:hypothetical protein
MPRHRRAFDVQSLQNRSRVTNGRKLFLPGVDGRSALARRARDIAAAIASDLGGHDHLSEAQMQLVRRATLIAVSCEQMEAKAAAGEQIDLDLFGKLTDRLGRALQRLGLRRIPRDVTVDPLQYARQREIEVVE